MLPKSIKVFSVSEITGEIKSLMEGAFPSVFILGEVSNFASPSSGHWYFTLKDENAQVRCVAFRSVASRIRFMPEDGLSIVVGGRITVYDRRGEYQVIVEYLEPRGAGALQLAFEQMKERLEKEGLFETALKRPLPRFPGRIAVITSPTGAAIRDILHVFERRSPHVNVSILPVSVQGVSAAVEIADAISDANSLLPRPDLIILARGGGSLEDLWSFNEEMVARAIRASALPVITGVGHETDFTIADFAADVRAPTPSAAAEISVRDSGELSGAIANLLARLGKSVEAIMDRLDYSLARLSDSLVSPEKHFGNLLSDVEDLGGRLSASALSAADDRAGRIDILRLNLFMRDPVRKIENLFLVVDELSARLGKRCELAISRFKGAASELAAELNALSPLAVMRRGYSVTSSGDGVILRDAFKVGVGDSIRTRLSNGELSSRVEKVKPVSADAEKGNDET